MTEYDLNPDKFIALKAKENLSNWRTINLNIAISGATCIDKYRFINNLTGLNVSDMNNLVDEYNILAPSKPTPYRHISNSNYIIWDLPECYHKNKQDYLNLLKINNYDLFLIFQSSNSEQIDIWLAKELYLYKKKVFFIRNYSNFVQSSLDANNLVETIQVEIEGEESNDDNDSFQEDNVYLISPHFEYRYKLDFNRLLIDLINSLDYEKMQVMLLSTEPISKEIIEKKLKLLKSKTFYSAIVSSIMGTFSLPDVFIKIDTEFLSTEIWFYLEQFGLNIERLKDLADKNNILFEKITGSISKHKYGSLVLINEIHFLSQAILKVLPMFSITSDIVSLFPLVGSIVEESLSYAATKYALNNILEEFFQISADLIDILNESELIKVIKEQHGTDKIKLA